MRSKNCYYPECKKCGIGIRNCPFRQIYSEPLHLVEKEIYYKLRELDSIRERIKLFRSVSNEIRNGDYDGKLNALGNPIVYPSDVYVDLDLNSLMVDEHECLAVLRDLRRREHNITKVLLKRRLQ